MKMSCQCQKPDPTDNRLCPTHKACSLLEEKNQVIWRDLFLTDPC